MTSRRDPQTLGQLPVSVYLICLLMLYLTTLSVAQSMLRRMAGSLVNTESEETVVVQF
jgi:hypothetical protein